MHSLSTEGSASERRKSSVVFNKVLEKYEPVENRTQTLEYENIERREFQSTSSSRLSVFSTVSDMSFSRLNMKNKFIFVIIILIMMFFLGVAVGAMIAQSFFCIEDRSQQLHLHKAGYFSKFPDLSFRKKQYH